jgi:hypothetical protein
MPFTLEINGFTVHAATAADVRELVGVAVPARTLAEALGKPARKKPGPKPKPREDEVLTAADKKRLAAEVPLICRKPFGCGKAFQSENRRAHYCPSCTAKRDEGRAA